MLTAVKGYYDGTRVIVDESDKGGLTPGDQLVITVLNRGVPLRGETLAEKRKRLVDEGLCVSEKGRTTEEIDRYIKEMRENDRI